MKLHDLIQEKETFRIAFLGGSITEGAGASSHANRYSTRTVSALGKRYPEVKFEEVNAGIGGTPSALGMFRLERDVLSKKPDLLFVEFAVNDGGDPNCGRFMEAIVRESLAYDPKLPIVFLYTFSASMYEGYRQGQDPRSVCIHREIAEYYRIPQINLGPDLAQKIYDYGGNYLNFMKDGAHPSDDGYATYTDTIMANLFQKDFDIILPEKPLSETVFQNPRMIFAEDLVQEGWCISSHSLCGRTPNYVYASAPGTKLHFSFEGCILGTLCGIEKDTGDLSVTVDGKDFGVVSTWDEYALRFNRGTYLLLADNLAPGHHEVVLEILPTKKEKSEGTFIRIGALLVG